MSRHCQNRTTRNGRLVLCGGPMELIRTTPKAEWYRCAVCRHKTVVQFFDQYTGGGS